MHEQCGHCRVLTTWKQEPALWMVEGVHCFTEF